MRLRRLSAVLALSVLALAACGDDDDGSDVASGGSGSASGADAEPSFAAGTTMAKIAEKGTITVGTKFDQPLFGEKTLGDEVEGFDVEIARIIAEELGVEMKTVEAVSKNREPFIQNGTVDIVAATYTINDKRKQVVDFAGPYYITGQSLMVRADDDSITGTDSLAGKKVCSVEGSTPADRIKEVAPQAQVTLYDAYGKCAQDLKNGTVDAVTTDEAILLGLMSKNEGAFKTVGEQFSEEPYGIGLKKGDTEFRNFINDVLEEAYEDGRWLEALEKTVGTVQEELPEPPPVDRY